MRSYRDGWIPNPVITGVFIKRGHLNTDKDTAKTLCEDEGKDQGVASTHQGTQKISSKLPEAGEEAWNRSSSHCPQKEPILLTPSPRTSSF